MRYTQFYLRLAAWRERHRSLAACIPLGFIAVLLGLTQLGNRNRELHDPCYAAVLVLLGFAALGYLVHLLLLKNEARRGSSSKEGTVPNGEPATQPNSSKATDGPPSVS